MAEYDNKCRGSLWKVAPEKRTEDWHAPYAGTYVDENGVEYYVNLWGKKAEGHENRPDITFKIGKRKGDAAKPAAPLSTDFESDIPFN